jgi:hypothetical protein
MKFVYIYFLVLLSFAELLVSVSCFLISQKPLLSVRFCKKLNPL